VGLQVSAPPAAPRPKALPVIPHLVPAEMRAERRWVVWRYTWKADKEKWDKPPMIATAEGEPEAPADTTDPATWRSFDEAVAAYGTGRWDGIGFALGDGWVGYDCDVLDEAAEHVDLLDSYTEVSPSSRGFHTIMIGRKPDGRCRVGAHELYSRGRYFTVTGQVVRRMPVMERSAQIAELHARLFPKKAEAPRATAAPSGAGLTDMEVVEKAIASKNGEKFGKLFEGEWQGLYDSQSQADAALCSTLAFWTRKDAEQMDRVFRRSGLMRPKWDEPRGDGTYGGDTVANAAAFCKEVYEPPKPAAGAALVIRSAADVPIERLEKRWNGRLVRKNFGFLVGPGGVGKGMLMADVAARLSTGAPFPGEPGGRREPLLVMFCVVEDSDGRVAARLRVAGADLQNVKFVYGPQIDVAGLATQSAIRFDDDAGKMVEAAKDLGAGAILMETLVEHFGDRAGRASRRSTNNEADVRASLAPFRALCAEAGLLSLAAIHPRKSTEGGIEDSISGSAAFRNVTRGVLHVYKDPGDESPNPVRLLCTSKANHLKGNPPTLRFRIVSWDEELGMACGCGDFDCGHEGRVVWEPDLVDPRTAEDVWREIAESRKPRRDLRVVTAEEFLQRLMKDGSIDMKPADIFAAAGREGLAKSAVERAKANLGLVAKKSGFPAAVVGWTEGGM
jgi:hypothetical protein